jgi:hypothetical protein
LAVRSHQARSCGQSSSDAVDGEHVFATNWQARCTVRGVPQHSDSTEGLGCGGMQGVMPKLRASAA